MNNIVDIDHPLRAMLIKRSNLGTGIRAKKIIFNASGSNCQCGKVLHCKECCCCSSSFSSSNLSSLLLVD